MQFSYIILAFLTFTLIACQENELKQKEVVSRNWKSDFPLDTSRVLLGAMNASYGYRFLYPQFFNEVVDTINPKLGHSIYNSPNGDATLKFFVEGDIRIDQSKVTKEQLGKINFALLDQDSLIKNGKHAMSSNLNIVKSNLIIGEPTSYTLPSIHYIGEKENHEVIWAIELSQVPVSGNLCFKHMYFEYPKEQKELYQPIGLEMLYHFGMKY